MPSTSLPLSTTPTADPFEPTRGSSSALMLIPATSLSTYHTYAPDSGSKSIAPPENLGALTVGIIGGVLTTFLVVFGIILLMLYRRQKGNTVKEAITRRHHVFQTTDMQTAGLHEKEGSMPRRRYEKECCMPGAFVSTELPA